MATTEILEDISLSSTLVKMVVRPDVIITVLVVVVVVVLFLWFLRKRRDDLKKEHQ